MNQDKPNDIYALIPKVIAAVGAVAKSQRSQQGYWFRGIDDLMMAVHGPMIEHGVFIVPTVIDQKREERPTRDNKGSLNYSIITVKHTFYAADGSFVECVTVGEAMDSADKSCNKAMSAALKYALIEVFCITTAQMEDADRDNPRPAARRQNEQPQNGNRQSVNHTPRFNGHPVPRQTIPMPAQKPSPFPPATQADQLIADESFRDHMHEAFELKGFNPQQQKLFLDYLCRTMQIADVYQLTEEKRGQLLDRINSGRFDRFLAPAQTTAVA